MQLAGRILRLRKSHAVCRKNSQAEKIPCSLQEGFSG